MTAKSSRFYWIECDHCGNASNEDDGYLAGSVEDARATAEERGWRTDEAPTVDHDGKYTCPVCIEEPGWADSEEDGDG